MSGNRNTVLWSKLASAGLAARLGLASGAILAAWLACAPVAFAIAQTQGIVASAVAAGVVWIGALVALPIASLLAGPATAVYGVTLAMLARAALPLALGVTLHFKVPSLAAAGMIYYMLAFYMVALAAETVLALAQVPRTPTSHTAI